MKNLAIWELWWNIWMDFRIFSPMHSAISMCSGSYKITLQTTAQCVAPSQCVAPFWRRILETFPVSKLVAGYLVGNIIESNFQPNYNFSIWSSVTLSKSKSPKTGQNVQKWGCLKAECCCSQLLKVFLNSKLSSWQRIGNKFMSSYHLTHQASHLANQDRINLDFLKVTSEVHQFSWGNYIFEIYLKPWKWRIFFFLGIFLTKTSLSFPKFIFYCS